MKGEKRYIDYQTKLTTRDKEDDLILEGYFIKFNEETELYRDVYEVIDPLAVSKSLENNDIKAFFNHDPAIVLGRTGNSTLELKADQKGLKGTIKINKEDNEAVNIYNRVKRGDINKCSFGFNIINEEITRREDGATLIRILEANLIEVSIVTFPAYENTNIEARKSIEQRKKQLEETRLEGFEQRKKAIFKQYEVETEKKLTPLEKNQKELKELQHERRILEADLKEEYPEADFGDDINLRGKIDSRRHSKLLFAIDDELNKAKVKLKASESKMEKALNHLRSANSEKELQEATDLNKRRMKEHQEAKTEYKLIKELREAALLEASKVIRVGWDIFSHTKEIEELLREKKLREKGENKDMKTTRETRRAIHNYVQTRGSDTGSLKTNDIGVLIPEEIIYDESLELRSEIDLSIFSTVLKAKSGSGSFPLMKRQTLGLKSADELEDSELAKPNFEEVDWKVKTFRGVLPISQESLDDSIVDLSGLVIRSAKEQKIITNNTEITKVYKEFPKKEVSSVDDIKDIMNVDIPAGYKTFIVASKSFYNIIDKLKDRNERYLLQPDSTSPTGQSVSGSPIIIVEDELLGEKGQPNAFIGDTYRAVLYVDRLELALYWVQHLNFGKYLGAATRLDATKLDPDAGFYVTWNSATEAAAAVEEVEEVE